MTPAEYKAAREAIGTQAEVAEKLGVDRGTIARRETGKLTISLEVELALKYLQPSKIKRK